MAVPEESANGDGASPESSTEGDGVQFTTMAPPFYSANGYGKPPSESPTKGDGVQLATMAPPPERPADGGVGELPE